MSDPVPRPRILHPESRRQDARPKILDTGSRILDTGSWILDPGHTGAWIQDPIDARQDIGDIMAIANELRDNGASVYFWNAMHSSVRQGAEAQAPISLQASTRRDHQNSGRSVGILWV